jgi:hypothetical protein
MNPMTIVFVVGGILLIGAVARFLTRSTVYPQLDLAEIDRDRLFSDGEQLLKDSEAWPTQLEDGSVALASSLEPFVVRTVRYRVEVDADFERAVDHVKNMCYCGPTTRESKDKFEETLYEGNAGASDHEWIRRSVHVSPPPGSNRDAVVAYFQDRPGPRSYRIGFRSVDSIDGKAIATHQGASRFMVNPALYRVEETTPGRVCISKIEAVDPQGLVSPLMNNYFISLAFFRKYMFDEAKAMRDDLEAT